MKSFTIAEPSEVSENAAVVSVSETTTSQLLLPGLDLIIISIILESGLMMLPSSSMMVSSIFAFCCGLIALIACHSESTICGLPFTTSALVMPVTISSRSVRISVIAESASPVRPG